MSPQQLLGQRSEPADDIYALGATLYELLTGKPPFYTGSLAVQIREIPPPRLNERRQELGIEGEPVPAAWEETILACLAKKSGERPATAAKVLEKLGLAPGLKASPQSSPPMALARTPSRKRLWQIVAGAALLALIAAAGWFWICLPAQGRKAELAQRNHAAILARIEGTPDSAPPATVAATDQAVRDYLATAPAALKPDVAAAWAGQQAACAAYQTSNAPGDLTVRTTPVGAEVQVGTLPWSKSPLTVKDQKTGRYPVQIRLSGYDDWNGEAEIKAGGSPELSVPLVRSQGGLVVETEPAGLRFRLQGPDHSESGTAGPQPHELPTGRYLLTVSRRGFADVTRYVEVKPHSTAVEKIVVGNAIAGTWTWTLPGRGSAAGGTLTLTLAYRDGRLTGSASNAGRLAGAEPGLSDLVFENDRLAFSLVRNIQGFRIETKYSGRLDGDVIRGMVETPGRGGQMVRREWEARRVK